jgi:hypothetical protein
MSDTNKESSAILGKRQALLLMNWLSITAPEILTAEELAPRLGILLGLQLPPAQKLHLLEALFIRFDRCFDEQVSHFVGVKVPLNPVTHRKVNLLLDVIGDFALGYEGILNALASDAPEDDTRLCLERAVFCLRNHLYVSYLVGCPAGLGIWQRLHGAFLRNWQSARATLPSYIEALLLATAQPAALTAREIVCIAAYARQHARQGQISEAMPENNEGAFWIPLQQDFHAFPLSRRSPPPGARVIYFSCYDIVAQTQLYLDDIVRNRAHPEILDEAGSRQNSIHILERLISSWGHPSQRRFPRHRKSYRGRLCVGLKQLHAFLKTPESPPDDNLSQWIITNESPDGYTLMFLNGATNPIAVGEIVALLPNEPPQEGAPSQEGGPPQESAAHHPVGMIRWVQSETPEHIEIGVQVLAPTAMPAMLTIQDEVLRAEALILPGPPVLPNAAILVAPADVVTEQNRSRILVARDGEPSHMVYVLTMREQSRYVAVFMVAEATPFPERDVSARER